MDKENFKNYFEHVIGLNLFNVWANYHNIKTYLRHVELPLTLSNLFRFSVTKGQLFLTCERNESNWMKRIKWNRLIINPYERKIILIADLIRGDMKNLPDFGAFALSIPYDLNKKAKIIAGYKKIHFKEMHISEDGIVFSKKNFFSIPVKVIREQNEEIFHRDEKRPYNSLKNIQLNRLISTNVMHATYKEGSVPPTFFDSSLEKLLKPFNEEEVIAYSKHVSSINGNLGEIYTPMPEHLKELAHKEMDYGDWWEKSVERKYKENK